MDRNTIQQRLDTAAISGGVLGEIALLRQAVAVLQQENKDLRQRNEEQEFEKRAANKRELERERAAHEREHNRRVNNHDLGRERATHDDEEFDRRRANNRDLGRERAAHDDEEFDRRRANNRDLGRERAAYHVRDIDRRATRVTPCVGRESRDATPFSSER